MRWNSVLASAVIAGVAFSATAAHAQETIRLRIASGHPPVNTYVNLMQNFFVPEATRRVAEETDYTLEFVEGYGGSMVSVSETLEGVQSGIIDIGGFCFCFEPSNLPVHAFQAMLPFGTMSPVMSLELARAVYDEVPHMREVFETQFNQKLIALIADNGYNLGTNFQWDSISDIQGEKIAGAGLNLKWLEHAGIVPVQSSLPDAYTSMQTGVYDGWIMFPSGWVNFKLYEVGKFYTEIGFGALTWHGLTINSRTWDNLPEEVRTIVAEVATEYETRTGTVNEEDYPKQIQILRDNGVDVRTLDESVRQEWAESLAAWPKEMAEDLDSRGLPGTETLSFAIEKAEELGHSWPVRYSLD